MQLTHIHYYIQKNFFSNKIIAVWNSLPNVVISVDSTNIFKYRLDKFWYNQDLKFDWNAGIARFGSLSLKCTWSVCIFV